MPDLLRCLILMLAITHAADAQRLRADTLIVHFGFDHSNIRSGDSAALVSLASKAADSILLVGYTDTAGSDHYNDRLSYRRAIAARTAIKNSLSPALPVRLEARGETHPLPGNDSLSRRVELIVYYHVRDTPVVARIDTPQTRPDNEPDTAFGLENINFIANTPTLTDASRAALPNSVAYLRNFSDRYLEIDGFCNQPGRLLSEKDPLFILSVKRAKFIYDYLIQQGFDSTHLRYKGLGNANPLNAHPTTAHEMDQNMRVEIKVFRKPQP